MVPLRRDRATSVCATVPTYITISPVLIAFAKFVSALQAASVPDLRRRVHLIGRVSRLGRQTQNVQATPDPPSVPPHQSPAKVRD